MQRLDVDDGGNVLLVDQRADPRSGSSFAGRSASPWFAASAPGAGWALLPLLLAAWGGSGGAADSLAAASAPASASTAASASTSSPGAAPAPASAPVSPPAPPTAPPSSPAPPPAPAS